MEQSPYIENIEEKNIAPRRRNTKWLWAIIAILVLAVVYRVGYNAGKSGYTFSPSEFKVVNQNNQPGQVDYNLLWDAIKVVSNKYIDSDQVDQQKILYGAIKGAVAAVGDEYTEFFDPETYKEFKTELQGSFSGIGAEVGKRDGNIIIVAPLDGTPAQRAGLMPQDIILSVDGQSVADKTIDEAVRLIRGETGTEVTLSIYRQGKDAPFDVKIVRDNIEVKSVNVEYKEVEGKQIAILTITRFGDDTEKLFDEAANDIVAHNVSGIVLDLRSNPGGYLDTAVKVASDWLPAGTLVVTEAHSESDTIKYTSTGKNRLGNIKTKVLINGGSASAAEILSGALRDNGKAELIGEKSFGKGSVQELVPLDGGNSAVKVTVAKWITPSGINLNHNGLDPNIEVKNTEQDYEAGRDPQLDKALQEVIK